MASALSSPQPSVSIPNRQPRHRHRGSVASSASGSQRGEPKEYFALLTNLPYLLDQRSCTKNKDVHWKPIKDLMRKVINKEDDGRDIRPQVADSGKVNIVSDNPGVGDRPSTCGYAVCTLKNETHANRALRWLGGNVWYGWTLSIMICVKVGQDHRLLNSRDRTMFNEPINLNPLSPINDRSLLRPAPAQPLTSLPMGAPLRPDSRVRLPSQMHQVYPSPVHLPHSAATTPPSHQIYPWAPQQQQQPGYCAMPAPPPADSMAMYPQPALPVYATLAPDSPSVNIMVQVDEHNWRPYAYPLPTATAPPTAAVPAQAAAGQYYAPSATAAVPMTAAAYTPYAVAQPVLSPSAVANFGANTMPASASSSSASTAAPRAYHVNTAAASRHSNPSPNASNSSCQSASANRSPTSSPASTVSVAASVLVRNLPLKASQAAVASYIQRSGVVIRRYEARESWVADGNGSSSKSSGGGNTSGTSRKQLCAVLGFATVDEARRVQAWTDGRAWEGRRIGCEMLREDGVCGTAGNTANTAGPTVDEVEEGPTATKRSVVDKSGSVEEKDSEGGVREGPIIANGSEEDVLSA